MQSYDILDNKIILRTHDRVCETPEEVVESDLFRGIVAAAVGKLARRRSILMQVFGKAEASEKDVDTFIEAVRFLAKMEAELVPNVVPGAKTLLRDPARFNDLVEYIYNFWRSFDRFIISDSQGRDRDRRPYRTFNETVGVLTNLIRQLYRDVQENVTGRHPRIYRQVASGAEVSTIAVSRNIPLPSDYQFLNQVPVIRQMLLYPPLILTPTMNKRSGRFERVADSPLKGQHLNPQEWLCYPAKVGELIVLVYFHYRYAELGHSLCNLFQLAEDEDLSRMPDAVFCYGVPEESVKRFNSGSTVFFDDEKNNLLVGAVPLSNELGYFGYLKKMVLTLHNVIMMKRGILPFHGALVRMILKGDLDRTILFMGDTGAGKSETLEALRGLGEEFIQDLIVVADDMGSVRIASDGKVLGYGTEIGAFLRLDDLQPGYALGQIDRAIIMSANQVNARIIIPITTYDQVIKGEKVDFIFYANNYDMIDEEHPIVERFTDVERALNVFREGTAMSKGTTTSTGLVHSYFANVFGPAQYKEMHEPLARKYFEHCFKSGVFVGQVRTRLGLSGWERKGPEEAAQELLRIIRQKH
ncbi:MAG: phosphoenolpyruvate carboxykinase [Candidatus Omnitrophica bacterium]|nr:phosphoenolpyruvate carboxykinase [Candidatus Omnitrophota bacterium]